MSYRVLIVDDVEADLDCTRLVLSEDLDVQVVATTSPDEGISFVKADPTGFAAILLDQNMPKKDGVSTAEEMLAINPNLCIGIFTADQSREVLKRCLSVGVKDFIEKHQDEEVVRSVVRALCHKWENRPQLFRPTPQPSDDEELILSTGFIGRSKQTRDLARLVRRAAKVDANVLIRGESGTGKELVARAIHYQSRRKNRPFVAINVNAIAENLAESELFGHVKGAFTGADRLNEGKILAAQGGTLFLDEIGDLKPDLQVKLLRVLQERKVTPVGGSKAIDLDVRIITATHVDLDKAILDGRFREDLYYRIHVLPIHVPPLRDRPEDIQPLIAHFLKLYGGEDRQISMKTVRCLERFSWRGNVRELENEIQRIVSLSDRIIEPKDLNEKIQRACELDLKEQNSVPPYAAFKRQMEELELEYLYSVIRKYGSLREASRLGFKAPKSSIHSRLKALEADLNPIEKKEGFHEKEL